MASNNSQKNDNDIVAEINMTPLIDVMLVLLIIFMVNASAAIEAAFNVDLPRAGQTAPVKAATNVMVSLSRNGEIAVQGKTIKVEQFKEEITEALKKEKTTAVLFAADTKAEFGRAVELIDVAKSSGASEFSIAAQVDINARLNKK